MSVEWVVALRRCALDGLLMGRASIKPGLSKPGRQTPAKADAPSGVLSDFDTQLMLQVREGNPDAANALMRRNFDRVSRFIARVVRNPRPIEDLTQDVFYQVLKSAPRYEPNAKFSTWLYRIATNTARNYLSQAYVRKRRDQDPETGKPDPVDRAGSSPDRQLSLDELQARVSAAISSLPVNQRIALTLFQYEELSYEQIATVLDTTVESVRCLLKRGRESLRRKLSGLV